MPFAGRKLNPGGTAPELSTLESHSLVSDLRAHCRRYEPSRALSRGVCENEFLGPAQFKNDPAFPYGRSRSSRTFEFRAQAPDTVHGSKLKAFPASIATVLEADP